LLILLLIKAYAFLQLKTSNFSIETPPSKAVAMSRDMKDTLLDTLSLNEIVKP